MSNKKALYALTRRKNNKAKEQIRSSPSSLLKDALASHRQGHIQKALELYEQILQASVENFDALHMAGVACKQLGMVEQALHYFEKAILVQPMNAVLQSNYGNLLLICKDYEQAVCAYDCAISLTENFADAHYNRGIAFSSLGKYEEAVRSYSRAIELNKESVDYYLSRGKAFFELARYELAISDYQSILEFKEKDYQALLNLGLAYFRAKKISLSLQSFQEAESIEDKESELHYFKGNALREMGQAVDALKSYLRAIELKPEEAKYFLDLGNAQLNLGNLGGALQSYQQALKIDPTYPYLLGHYVHVKCQVADWDDLPEHLNALRVGINSEQKVTTPFPLLALIDSPEISQKASDIYCQDQCQKMEQTTISCLPKISAENSKKIKIGYFSSDFYRHATAYLMAELFEQHDRSHFELIGFCFSGLKKDAMTERIQLAFDQYFEVSELCDQAIADLSREVGIDIAVDLKGYTQNSRSNIFAHRCAPVQVSYLGYPGTLSAPYMDFIIADKTLIPESQAKHYQEHIVYLPHCYQVNDSLRVIAPPNSAKNEHGLPENSFVYCCFNNTYKIQPEMFALWMGILKRTPDSVLWLIEDSLEAAQNLRKHALSHQVDPSRLIFAKRLDLSNHLERHRHANLFLDTLPYNAHTTASDALWSGLLVLSLMGKSFASRVGASLLNELKLNEFVCHTEKEYEDRAVFWAENQDLLKVQQRKLFAARNSSVLFRADIFARSLEEAYKQIYLQHKSGLGFQKIELT
jgi:predicted O-linked N-acetylglucosamine transferase (SPINDLY family)